MKANISKLWKPVCTSLFTVVVAFGTMADDSSPQPSSPQAVAPRGPEKSCKGTVIALDQNEYVLQVRGPLLLHKTFNLGSHCVYSEMGRANLPINTLRPGEMVRVDYQDLHGVLIADRVEQIPMRVEGTVIALDPANHTLTVRQTPLKKQLRLPGDCQVLLRDGKVGSMDDIKVGSYVTVTYETPNDTPTARQIAQTSLQFTGTVTAIDLDDHTIKAKAVFGAKKFNLADRCAIVINGQPNGRLADLRPEEKLVFSYDEINGVNVVNRIAPEESQANHMTASSQSQGF